MVIGMISTLVCRLLNGVYRSNITELLFEIQRYDPERWDIISRISGVKEFTITASSILNLWKIEYALRQIESGKIGQKHFYDDERIESLINAVRYRERSVLAFTLCILFVLAWPLALSLLDKYILS